MKKLFLVLSTTVVLLATASAVAQKQQKEDKPAEDKPADDNGPSVWMRMKMKYSKNILSALATEDFSALRDNAQKMNALSQLETWARGKDSAYQTQLAIFRYANKAIIREAGKKNIDGATLAFTQMTVSCVNCHKVIRNREPVTTSLSKPFTHTLATDAEYYRSGPQQAQPSDGTFAKGTNVRIVQKTGSYALVESSSGDRGFVEADAIELRRRQ